MRLILSLVSASLLLIVIAFLPFKSNETPELSSEINEYNVLDDRNYLTSKILTLGSESTYRIFITQNGDMPFGVRHLRAHLIGELIFENEGVDGISVCDASFGFGCFHGFFTAGFSDMGVSFIKEADAICVARYGVMGTGCQHGIGHGIVEFNGRSKLNNTLDLCEDTYQPTPLLGCTSGVFMEYNTPSSASADGNIPKPYPYSDERPYAACEDVSNQYKESCYYELGGWWETTLKGNKVKMGKLCSEIMDIKLRNSCSLGIGNIIGPTNGYNVDKSINLCSKMPANVSVFCRIGVAWNMFSNPEHKNKATEMCLGLNYEDKKLCDEEYNLADLSS